MAWFNTSACPPAAQIAPAAESPHRSVHQTRCSPAAGWAVNTCAKSCGSGRVSGAEAARPSGWPCVGPSSRGAAPPSHDGAARAARRSERAVSLRGGEEREQVGEREQADERGWGGGNKGHTHTHTSTRHEHHQRSGLSFTSFSAARPRACVHPPLIISNPTRSRAGCWHSRAAGSEAASGATVTRLLHDGYTTVTGTHRRPAADPPPHASCRAH